MGNIAGKMYFNGALTQQQLIGIVIAVVAIVLVLAFAKKVMKLVLTGVVVVLALVHFGIMSPEKLQDVTKVVKEQGQGVFTQIADTSKNVQVDNSGEDISIKVNIEDQWVNVSDITSFIKSDDGSYSVVVGSNTYTVSDESVKSILDLLKK